MAGTSLLVLAIIVLALIAVALKLKLSSSDGPRSSDTWPLHGVRPLTTPEQVLFHRLSEALPEHIVLAQVQLSRFLKVNRGIRQTQAWRNRIDRKSIDYLICDRSFLVIAGVELDDASHHSNRRQVSDEHKNAALKAGGVRLIRWNVSSLPNGRQIRSELGIQVAGLD